MRLFPKAALTAIVAACIACSAGAVPISYEASLSGAAEAPPNASTGTGSAWIVIDTATHMLQVSFDFSDLIGTTTAAHIHGPTAMPLTGTAGVITTTPTFPGTPIGVTSGAFQGLFDLTMASSFNPAFITAQGGVAQAEAALAQALAQSKAYLNIHTTAFPEGEIRGFLTAIPLPAGLFLMLAVLLALGLAGRPLRQG